MVLPILPHFLALAIGHRAGVGSLTQHSLPLAYCGVQAVTGRERALFGDGRVVAIALPPRVTAILFYSASAEETLFIVVA